MPQLLSIIVQWVIVPGIMAALLVFDLAIVNAASRKSAELKLSTRAGFWAGLLLFVIYIVSQLNKIREPRFEFSELPGLLATPLVIGITAGFGFFLILRIAKKPPQLVGFIVLALAAVVPSAFFTYFFLESLRISLLYLTIGTALGTLLHIVIFPTSIKDIFEP